MRGHLDDDDEDDDDDNPMNWNMAGGMDDDDDLDQGDDHFSPEDRMELQDRIRKVMSGQAGKGGPARNTRSSLYAF